MILNGEALKPNVTPSLEITQFNSVLPTLTILSVLTVNCVWSVLSTITLVFVFNHYDLNTLRPREKERESMNAHFQK